MKVLSKQAPPAAGASLGSEDASRQCGRWAWWLWPHLWSLDAPLVALVWQRWWARAAGTRVSWPQEVVLALSVWLIYLADRLMDARCPAPFGHGTARHAYYRTRAQMFRPLVVSVGLLLTVVTPWWLTRQEFVAGLGLLALAAGYFGLTHHQRNSVWMAFFPKEAAVGLLFALGTGLFVGCQAAGLGWWLPWAWVGFAVICFLNCALITRWEDNARDRHDPASLLNAFPDLLRWLGAGCWVLGVAAFVCWGWSGKGMFLPLAVSGALLGALDAGRGNLSLDALRVLADVTLLTPLCFLPFIR